MKKKFVKAFVSVGLVTIILVFLGCPFIIKPGNGDLDLTFDPGELEPAEYTVLLEYADDNPFPDPTPSPVNDTTSADSIEITDLQEGSWVTSVSAMDGDGTEIGEKTETITILRNKLNTRTIEIDPFPVPPCTESAAADSITATEHTVYAGSTLTFSVNGGLLGTGADWCWYSGSCGGTYLGSGPSIDVFPDSTTAYYVRAEGGCTRTTACANIEIEVHSLTLQRQDVLISWPCYYCYGGEVTGSTPLSAPNQVVPISAEPSVFISCMSDTCGSEYSFKEWMTISGSCFVEDRFSPDTTVTIYSGSAVLMAIYYY